MHLAAQNDVKRSAWSQHGHRTCLHGGYVEKKQISRESGNNTCQPFPGTNVSKYPVCAVCTMYMCVVKICPCMFMCVVKICSCV